MCNLNISTIKKYLCNHLFLYFKDKVKEVLAKQFNYNQSISITKLVNNL